MFQELEKSHLIKLKIILQSKFFYIGLLFFTFLYVIVYTNYISYTSKYSGEETQFNAKVLDYEIDGNKLAFTVLTDDKEKLKATYYIQTEEEKKELENEMRYGITIVLHGKLEEPYHNTIPNTFDYKEYLYNNHIYYTAKVTLGIARLQKGIIK